MSMVLTIGATWLLYLSGLFVLWTPLPLLLCYGRRGRGSYAIAFLSAALGLIVLYGFLLRDTGGELTWTQSFALPGFGLKGFFGSSVAWTSGLLYFAYYGVLAGLLGWAQERRFSIDRTFGLSVAIPALAIVVLALGVTVFGGLDLVAQARAYLLNVLDKVVSMGSATGITSQELRFVEMRRDDIVEQTLRMLPAGLLIGSIVTIWCNVLAARLWRPRKGREAAVTLFQHFGSLTRWRLNEKAIWVPIVAGAIYFFDYYVGPERTLGFFGVIAVNLLWLSGIFYFLQGLAIVAFFVQKKSSLFIKVLVYGVLVLFFQILALFVTALGLFDVWFDFRKRSEKQKE